MTGAVTPVRDRTALLGAGLVATAALLWAAIGLFATPLLEGGIRSCFAMSEPDVASSDATNIATTFTRDGDDYLIDGRKWFITGAAHPNCRFAIVLGRDDQAAEQAPHRRHSMLIVPMDAPGLSVERNIPVMQHRAPEGHCELVFRKVRVPVANRLGGAGDGFAMAQARLGPGRVHHCMRTLGQCELALEMMCERALERRPFGKPLSEFDNVKDWIAESRLEIDQARLLEMSLRVWKKLLVTELILRCLLWINPSAWNRN